MTTISAWIQHAIPLLKIKFQRKLILVWKLERLRTHAVYNLFHSISHKLFSFFTQNLHFSCSPEQSLCISWNDLFDSVETQTIPFEWGISWSAFFRHQTWLDWKAKQFSQDGEKSRKIESIGEIQFECKHLKMFARFTPTYAFNLLWDFINFRYRTLMGNFFSGRFNLCTW